MRRAHLWVGLLVGGISFARSANAHADDTIVVQPPATAAVTPVHVRFHAYKSKRAVIYRENAPDSWTLVCNTPCDVDLAPGTHLRAVYDKHDDEPHEFTLDGNSGSHLDVEVRPASKGPLAGGIVMTSIGGVTLLVGLVLLAVSSSPTLGGSDKSSLSTAGSVCSLGGGGLMIGGIVLMVTRSQEPRINQDSRDAVWSDGPRRASLAPAPPPTLGLRFTF